MRPWHDSTGQIGGIVMLTEVITARKRAETALYQSEARFQKLAANIPGAIYQFQLDANGRASFPYISSGVYRLLALTPTEIMQDANTIISKIHPDQLASFQKTVAASAQTLQPWQWEGQFSLPDGSFKWIKAASRPEQQPDGSILWDGVLIDINQLKQAESQLQKFNLRLEERVEQRTAELTSTNERLLSEIRQRQQAQQALIETKTLYKQILDAIPDLIFCKAADSQFIYGNKAFQNYYGLAAETLEGLTDASFIPSNSAAGYLEQDRYVFEPGYTLVSEAPVTHHAGEERMFSTIKTAIFDSEGQVMQVVGIARDIHDRKQSEVKLQRSEQLLKTVMNTLPQAVFWKDRNSVYLGCNRHFAEDAGLPPEDIIGKTDYELPWADTEAELYRQCDRRVMATSTPELHMLETQLQADGKQAWVNTNKAPLHDADGNVIGILGTYEDITGLKQVEANLRDREQFLRSVYEGSENPIFVVDVLENGEFRFSDMNPASQRALGLSPDEFKQRSPYPHFQENYRRCISSGQAIGYEECLVVNNKETWWLTTLNPLKDEANKIYRIVGTTFNITERRQIEQALKEQAQLSEFRAAIDSILTREDSLQNMLQRCCQVIVQHLDAAFARIWVLNAEENVLELQASAGLYTHTDGIHSRVPVGRFKIGLIAAERQPHLTNDVPNDPRVSDQAWARETGMVAFAGHPLIVEDELLGVVALFAQHPLSNSVLEILSFSANELALGLKRKQAELSLIRSEARFRQQAQELRQAMLELQQTQMHLIQSEKMSSLGQLVAGVAHEINNPVSFIFGNLVHAKDYARDLLSLVQLYQVHYPEPTSAIQQKVKTIELDFLIEDLPKLLNSMEVGAKRIQQIVQSLRIFSRMDVSEVKAVNLHEGIDSTLMILQNRLKEQPHRCAIQVVKKYDLLPLVECYPGQLNQVFMNLVSNAIDALEEALDRVDSKPETAEPAHSYQPTIELRTQLTGDRFVTISVSDNGSGMSEKTQQQVFNPFFTTKSVGKGTGMGLSISYQIIAEKHGGSLTCSSTPGQGTVFLVGIPLRQAAAHG